MTKEHGEWGVEDEHAPGSQRELGMMESGGRDARRPKSAHVRTAPEEWEGGEGGGVIVRIPSLSITGGLVGRGEEEAVGLGAGARLDVRPATADSKGRQRTIALEQLQLTVDVHPPALVLAHHVVAGLPSVRLYRCAHVTDVCCLAVGVHV